MKIKIDEKGQALLIVLFFSTIALLMVAALVYMAMRGISLSGMQKRYQTAIDAGYAGVGTTTAFLDTATTYQITNPAFVAASADTNANTTVSSGILTITASAPGTCFYSKLFNPFTPPNTPWVNCTANDATIDPTQNTDIEYAVNGVNTEYYVYSKIVDSHRGITANRPPGGLEVARGFTNPTGAQGLAIQAQAYFYYTVEVQAQDTHAVGTTKNTKETANISFDYAY